METKLVDKDASQDVRLDELDNTLLKHHQHFTNVCANVDTKFSMKNAAQDERTDNLQQHMADTCSNLDQKLCEKDSAQDARMDELSSVIQEHHAHFTASCDKLDSRLVESNTAHESRLK